MFPKIGKQKQYHLESGHSKLKLPNSSRTALFLFLFIIVQGFLTG